MTTTKLTCLITGNDVVGALPARVSIFDASGNCHVPEGVREYGYAMPPAWPSDWGIRGIRKYFYTDGQFEMELSCHEVSISIFHGLEYEPFQAKITLSSEQQILQVELQRIVNMPQLGWYCGDNHTHYLHGPVDYVLTKQDALKCAEAEGLDFICCLHKYLDLDQPMTITAKLGNTIGHFSYELGHYPVLNVGMRPPEDLTFSLSHAGKWFSLNDWVRDHKGTIIMGHPLFANHLYSGLLAADNQTATMMHYEIPVNAILGKVDTFELQNNRLSILCTWLNIWYRLLNCGINLPPSAGTDSCISVKTTLPPGVYRSYVMAEEHSLSAYLDGLKAGHSFITDGPLLFFSVDGKIPGEHINLSGESCRVKVQIRIKSILPLPEIELIQNGDVVKRWKTNSVMDYETTYELTVENSCWLALRVLRYRCKTAVVNTPELFAHTAPVYIDDKAAPRQSSEDALFFLQWLEVIRQYRLPQPYEAAETAINEAEQRFAVQLNHDARQRLIQFKEMPHPQNITDSITSIPWWCDDPVCLIKDVTSPYDVECLVVTVVAEPGYFYKLAARCMIENDMNIKDTEGYTYGKIVVFDEQGTYLEMAADKTIPGIWNDISTLFYLPVTAREVKLAYCLESYGRIKFEDITIKQLKGDLLRLPGI